MGRRSSTIRSPGPTAPVASTTATTTSTSSSDEVADSFSRSPERGAGLVQARGVDEDDLGVGAVEHAAHLGPGGVGPGRGDGDLGADHGLTRVDLPTLGRPDHGRRTPTGRRVTRRLARPARCAAMGTMRTRSMRRPLTRSATRRSPSDVDRLARDRDVAEQVEDQAADRVPGPGGQLGVDQLVDLVDRQAGADPQLAAAELLDRRLLDVELVDDLAHQLLDEVLEGDQAGRAAVLVDDDGQVELARPASRA